MKENLLKPIIEAILFVSSRPVLVQQIKDALKEVDTTQIKMVLQNLKEEYGKRNSGIKIVEVAEGYQMVSAPYLSDYLKEFFRIRHRERLSSPSLETLAIIAYRQPVSRLDIESIRGVNVEAVLKNLLEKGLIRIVGRRKTLGRPLLYGTTRQFLEYFGLRSLEELPKIEELSILYGQREQKD